MATTSLSNWFLAAAETEANTPIRAGAGESIPGVEFVAYPPVVWAAIGKLIALRRKSRGLSLDELSRQVGLPVQEVRRLEAGMLSRREADRLPAIARALELPEWGFRHLVETPAKPSAGLWKAAERFVVLTEEADGRADKEEQAVNDLLAALMAA